MVKNIVKTVACWVVLCCVAMLMTGASGVAGPSAADGAKVSETTVKVGGTSDRAVEVTFPNGHALTFDIERMRLVRWSAGKGKVQLARATGWGNPVWLADENGEAINADGYRGKAKWLGYKVLGSSVTLSWHMPLRDGSFAKVEETYSPALDDMYGTKFEGLKREIWLSVPAQHRVRKVGIDGAYGVGGTCEGHTTYNLNHGTSMEILEWTRSKPVSTTRSEWGYSPRQKLGAMAQPFLFIDHPKGNLIIYPERLDYSWSAHLQNHQGEKQDGIWPGFEVIVGEKSRTFLLGTINYVFSSDRRLKAPQRWINALSYLSNHFCGLYGLDNRRFFAHARHLAVYQITRATWPVSYDGRTLADKLARELRQMGCDAVFLDIWKYFWPEGEHDNERYVGYSVDTLDISDDFGGDKGMKEFTDIMHRHGIAVLLWANFQYLAGSKMSQVDGGRGSSLLRKHPEWRLLDHKGNTRGSGLTNMSFATGWKDYLIARLKHLHDNCGVDGLWVDNSAGAVGLVDYGVEPPAPMMKHYWDIVREIHEIGMTLLFEETGGATINGSAGYVWRKSMSMDGLEWGLTKSSVTGVHTQTDRQRGLLHQNAAGAQTLRRLTGADAQQTKYMRAMLRKHGGLPDRIHLVNLRYNKKTRRWDYDNTEWVYEGVKSVPYRAINTYRADEVRVEGSAARRGPARNGKPALLASQKRKSTHLLEWVSSVPVKDHPDAVNLLELRFSANYSSPVRQALQLYNFTTWKWAEVDSRNMPGRPQNFLWTVSGTGGHYVSEHGQFLIRVSAQSQKPFTLEVDLPTVTVDQGTGLRAPIMSLRRGKTRINPTSFIAIGGRPRLLKKSAARAAATRVPAAAPPLRSRAPDAETTDELLAKLAPPLQDRALAAFRLGERGDKSAVPPLIEALKDEHWRVRDRAAEALYKLQDPRAVEALTEALADPMWRVRFWAAKALGQLKAKAAVGALVKAIDDKNEAVTEYAALALAEIKDPAGLAALTKALASKNVTVRHSAAGALGRWGGDQAVAPLARAASDADRGVRLRAVTALAAIARPSCRDALLGALGDKSDRIRRRAIPAVAKLGDKRAIPLLENLLIGGFHQTRAATRAALKQLGADPVVYILKVASEPVTEENKKAIKARYGSEAKYRAHIALALGETRDKRALPKLQEMARDKDKEVKQVAARALRNISRQ